MGQAADTVGHRSVEAVERTAVTSTAPAHFEHDERWQTHTQDRWLKISSIPQQHVRRDCKPRKASGVSGKRKKVDHAPVGLVFTNRVSNTE